MSVLGQVLSVIILLWLAADVIWKLFDFDELENYEYATGRSKRPQDPGPIVFIATPWTWRRSIGYRWLAVDARRVRHALAWLTATPPWVEVNARRRSRFRTLRIVATAWMISVITAVSVVIIGSLQR